VARFRAVVYGAGPVNLRRSWTSLVVCLAISSVGPAAAADQTRDRAAARAAADAGADAFEQNDYAQALELFTRAEQLFHAPPHLLFMARSLEKLGRLVEAREAYLKLASEKLAASAPTAFKRAQASGEAELNGIEGRLSYVTLKVRGDRDETAVPTMDGAELPSAMIGIPMPVDPGTHKFSARNEQSGSPVVTVTLQEGARQTVELVLSEAASPPESGPSKQEPAAATTAVVADVPRAERGGSAQRTWGFVTLGAGAVIAGVSTAFTVSSINTRSDGDRLFERYGCGNPEGGCSDEEKDEVNAKDDEADKSRNLAIGGFVLGGAAIVTGLVLILTADSDENENQAERPARELHLIAGPGWLGAAGTF
jgi:hypothetical protein